MQHCVNVIDFSSVGQRMLTQAEMVTVMHVKGARLKTHLGHLTRCVRRIFIFSLRPSRLIPGLYLQPEHNHFHPPLSKFVIHSYPKSQLV